LNALRRDRVKQADSRYDSYNRLPNLESNKANSLFMASILVVFFANLGMLLQVSQGSRDWSILLVIGIVSTVLLLVLWAKYRRRKLICRGCGGLLTEVSRPLALNYDYLSRPGLILGGSFYSLRSQFLRRKKVWSKLTRWTRACHHCKLLEEKHFLKYAPLQKRELERVRQAISRND